MAHKTKAERSFEERTASAVKERDWAAVEKTYAQYGTYLELVDGDAPAGEAKIFQFPRPSAEDPDQGDQPDAG